MAPRPRQRSRDIRPQHCGDVAPGFAVAGNAHINYDLLRFAHGGSDIPSPKFDPCPPGQGFNLIGHACEDCPEGYVSSSDTQEEQRVACASGRFAAGQATTSARSACRGSTPMRPSRLGAAKAAPWALTLGTFS